jgi:hypothetical protein
VRVDQIQRMLAAAAAARAKMAPEVSSAMPMLRDATVSSDDEDVAELGMARVMMAPPLACDHAPAERSDSPPTCLLPKGGLSRLPVLRAAS